MNIIKNIAISIGAAVVTLLIGLSFVQPTTVVQRLGGASPDFSNSDYAVFGGVVHWFKQTAMLTATSSGGWSNNHFPLCSIQAPLGTSTLQFVSWSLTKATSTASVIDISTSTSRFASTTQLYSGVTVAANTLDARIWTPMGGSQHDNLIYSTASVPVYVNVLASGVDYGYRYGGKCQAEFIQL